MKRYEIPEAEIVMLEEEIMFGLIEVSIITESDGIEEGGEI